MKTFNDSFVNIVPNLAIDAYNVSEVTASDTNSLISIIEKYEHHPSITAIKNHMDKRGKNNFSFREKKLVPVKTKTLTTRKLHSSMIYQQNSLRNILIYLQQ